MHTFDSPYYTEQLITYIGNKRRLLPFINRGVERVRRALGRKKLAVLDGFSGSGVVSRMLKNCADTLHTNDLESYSQVISSCYLANRSSLDYAYICEKNAELNRRIEGNLKSGFITENYAPADDACIRKGERVFYTHENAMILDTLKSEIYSSVPQNMQPFFLAPLIAEASVHTNTSGVFKGFHKKNGIGHFGGVGENALQRIMKRISLPIPLFSEAECSVEVFKGDINAFVADSPFEYDLAYYDPPYNQHPYGSNYFMLNILASEQETVPIQEGVSGIAEQWNRSAYNKGRCAAEAMERLIRETKAKYILVSYSNEGLIPFGEFRALLGRYGRVSLLKQEYNTYRGSRNLNSRNIKVKELLWILNKS